jgi:hypothetical protein
MIVETSMFFPVLASITLDKDALAQDIGGDLLYLSGNIELLVGDSMMSLGQFPGALLLLPSLEVLASGMMRMRARHKTIEVVLVGDSTSLWILERTCGADSGIVLSHRGAETGLMRRDDLENAFGDAISAFLEFILARRSASTWGVSAMQIVESIAQVWPSAARAIPGAARAADG